MTVKYFCDRCNSELEKDKTDLTIETEKKYTFHLCTKCADNISITDLIADLVTKHAQKKRETLIDVGRPLLNIIISPSFSLNRVIDEKLGYELGTKVLRLRNKDYGGIKE